MSDPKRGGSRDISELKQRLGLSDEINVGSVGQPRDGDPRAAFALVDLERRSVSFERVPYDIESAVLAIVNAGLPDSLGQRLREGR